MTATMTPTQAWEYAAQWGSYIYSGDPGACMYGFNENFRVQSEKHRADCLAWIERCHADVSVNPDWYDVNEHDRLDALIEAVRRAPVVRH